MLQGSQAKSLAEVRVPQLQVAPRSVPPPPSAKREAATSGIRPAAVPPAAIPEDVSPDARLEPTAEEVLRAVRQLLFAPGPEQEQMIKDVARMMNTDDPNWVRPTVQDIVRSEMNAREQERVSSIEEMTSKCTKVAQDALHNMREMQAVKDQWQDGLDLGRKLLGKVATISEEVTRIEETQRLVRSEDATLKAHLAETRNQVGQLKSSMETASAQMAKRITDAERSHERRDAEEEERHQERKAEINKLLAKMEKERAEAQKVIDRAAKIGAGRVQRSSPFAGIVLTLLVIGGGLYGLFHFAHWYSSTKKAEQQTEQISPTVPTKERTSKPSKEKNTSSMSTLDD